MTTAIISGIFAIAGALGGVFFQTRNSRKSSIEQRQHEDRLRDLAYRRDLYARFAKVADDAWNATWELERAREWISEAGEENDAKEKVKASEEFEFRAHEHAKSILRLTSIRWEIELAAPADVVKTVQTIQNAVVEEEVAPISFYDEMPEKIKDFVIVARKDLGLPESSITI